jgi:hypothetical protein
MRRTKISTKEGPRRSHAAKKDQDQYQWVRKNTMPEQKFDACKEKRDIQRG